MTELKPCPFCGEKASLKINFSNYYIECVSIGCLMLVQTKNIHKSRTVAIKAWNTRTP